MTLNTVGKVKLCLNNFQLNSVAITRRRIVARFADKFGLIYFGAVNQHIDDHKVIRGLTVSSAHQDNNYCVGSVNGYDIAFVDRRDTVWQTYDPKAKCNWLILALDLHTEIRIPHFFIEAVNHDIKHYVALFSTFPNMQDINSDSLDAHCTEFTGRFKIYARPAKALEVYTLFPLETIRMLGAHFWPLSIEQHNNVLYIYSVRTNVTTGLLDTMMKNGLWLAGNLDVNAESIET
jgi:hypothetical protein